MINKFKIIDGRDFINGKISYHDDKKSKNNSHEARLLIESDIYEGSLRLELETFEDTRDNALNELNLAFEKLMYQFKKDWNLKE